MNNLVKRFYRTLINFILLHKKALLLKKRELEQKLIEYIHKASVNAVTKGLL